MQDSITAVLNLAGLGLQIEGVLIIAYSVRKLAFRKKGKFDPVQFDTKIFDTSTTSDNAPTDAKTNEKIEEVTIPDTNKAIFGVISIIAGLVFQMFAVFTSP